MQYNRTFRRIVTARSDSNRSYVLEDGRVEEGSLGNFNLWQSDPLAAGRGSSPAAQAFPFVPAPGSNLVRVFRLPPDGPGASAAQLRQMAVDFGAAIGLPGCQPDTSRHPFMHVTPTTDYVMLLAGEVSLLLDEGGPVALQPLDIVIQRETNHAWVNTGGVDAFLLSVMNARAGTANEGNSKP